MKIRAAIAAIVLFVATVATGQQLTNVTGHLQEPNGGAIQSGTYAKFQLLYCGPNQAKVIGTAIIPQTTFTLRPDVNGVLATQLYGQDQLACGAATGTTRWAVQYFVDNNPGPVNRYYIWADPGQNFAFNLDTAVQDDLTVPQGALYTNSSGSQTLTIKPGQKVSVSGGTLDLTGTTVAGATGSPGPAGAAATVNVGTTTTVSSVNPASVTNSGSSSAAVFNFQIPQGPAGAAGATGAQGPAGASGTVVNWRGTWSGVTAYVAGDGVTLAGSSYVALASSTNITPGTDASKWQLIAAAGASGAGGSGVDCSTFSGADWGAQLAACLSATCGTTSAADISKLTGTLATSVTLGQSNCKITMASQTLAFAADKQVLFQGGSDVDVIGIGASSLFNAPAGTSVQPIQINENNVTFRRLRVEGNRGVAGTSPNIKVGDSTHHVSGVHFYEVFSNHAGTYGINLTSCQHCSFENGGGTINGRSMALISENAAATFDITLKGNTGTDNEQLNTAGGGGTNCVLTSSTNDGPTFLYDLIIDHNYCNLTVPATSGFGAGIQINGAHDVKITDNTVDGATHEGISFTGYNYRVSRNTVRNSTTGGILIFATGSAAHDIQVEDNTTYDNSQYGIKLHLPVAGSTANYISIRRNRSYAALATQNNGVLINNDAGGGAGNVLTGVYIENNMLAGNTTNAYNNACAANCTGTIYLFDNDGVPQDLLIDPTGSTTSLPRQFGFNPDISGVQAVRLEHGEVFSGVQNAVGDRVQYFSKKPIEFRGGTNSSSPPSFVALSGTPTNEPGVSFLNSVATAPITLFKAAPAQSADALQVQDSTGTNLFKVTAAGSAIVGSGDGGTYTTGKYVSTVATGTAPMTVASTTKVANFNADTVDGFSSNALFTGVWTDIVNWGNFGVNNYGFWTPTKLVKLKTIEVRAQLVGSGGTCLQTPQIDIFQNGASITGSAPISVPINGAYATATLNVAVTDLAHPLNTRLTRQDDCTNHVQFIHVAVAYEMNQ